jgi:hypothetical protein
VACAAGQLTNLMVKDTAKIQDMMLFGHNIWSAPLTAACRFVGCGPMMQLGHLVALLQALLSFPSTLASSVFLCRPLRRRLRPCKALQGREMPVSPRGTTWHTHQHRGLAARPAV